MWKSWMQAEALDVSDYDVEYVHFHYKPFICYTFIHSNWQKDRIRWEQEVGNCSLFRMGQPAQLQFIVSVDIFQFLSLSSSFWPLSYLIYCIFKLRKFRIK